ncbi:MAG: peptide deformylase [Planctomycetales bacterium]
MQIVPYPHPALRWKSKPVTEINDYLRKTVREMFDLMYAARGIGLAANQVALPWRFFIINLTGDPEQKDEELVFINPEIIKRKGSVEDEEGCLSFPKLYANVRRAEEIVVEAFDLDGQGFQMTLDELASRAIQHETDHLDGILFTDKVSDGVKRELEGVISDFESQFRQKQAAGEVPTDETLTQELRRLESGPPRE